MSRIHEALKKAERERAAQKPGEADLSGLDRIPLSTAMPEIPGDPAEAQSVAPSSSEYLSYDDVRARCSGVRWQLDPHQNIFQDGDPATPEAEQFRTLRSRLYQLRGNQPLRTILVTSALLGEGKSFVANNLAHAIIRQPDRRALILDADLRRARLHTVLGAPAAPGLTEYLSGDADEMSVLQCGMGSNLCFIPGGNPVRNPSELLSNGRLKILLERMAPLFDWVILDSPPCVPVADASVLAEMCDGVLLVVRSGSTPVGAAQKAVQELRGKHIVGVVLNAIGKTHLDHESYYQGYGYGETAPNGHRSATPA